MLEQVLERIAIALERIAAVHAGQGALDTDTTKKKPGRPPKEAPILPGIVDVDPLAVDAPAVKTFTVDEIRTALVAFKEKNGLDKTKALMIKYGADAAKPVITTIPAAEYAELMKECI